MPKDNTPFFLDIHRSAHAQSLRECGRALIQW